MTNYRLFIMIAICLSIALPVNANKRSDIIQLQQRLHEVAAGLPSDYGIAAVDLKDGSTASVNGNKTYPMASTMKIAVAAVYLSHVEYGHRNLNAIIDGRTASEQISRMIVSSDNYSTDLLIMNLGGPKEIQKWIDHNEIKGIRVDRTIAQILRDKRDLNDWQDVSTPLGMADLLAKLDGGNVLQPNGRQYLLDLMNQVRTGTRRIRGLLPAGVRVEDKTGTLNGITNDVGYIVMPNGNRIAIVVFVRGGVNRTLGIAITARTIYDHFNSLTSNTWNTVTEVPEN